MDTTNLSNNADIDFGAIFSGDGGGGGSSNDGIDYEKAANVIQKVGQAVKSLFSRKANDDAKSLEQWANVYVSWINDATPRETYEIFTEHSDLKLAKTRRSVWNSVFTSALGADSWDDRDQISEPERLAAIEATITEINRFMKKTGQQVDMSELTNASPSNVIWDPTSGTGGRGIADGRPVNNQPVLQGSVTNPMMKGNTPYYIIAGLILVSLVLYIIKK